MLQKNPRNRPSLVAILSSPVYTKWQIDLHQYSKIMLLDTAEQKCDISTNFEDNFRASNHMIICNLNPVTRLNDFVPGEQTLH